MCTVIAPVAAVKRALQYARLPRHPFEENLFQTYNFWSPLNSGKAVRWNDDCSKDVVYLDEPRVKQAAMNNIWTVESKNSIEYKNARL